MKYQLSSRRLGGSLSVVSAPTIRLGYQVTIELPELST